MNMEASVAVKAVAATSAVLPKGEPHPLVGWTFLSVTRTNDDKEEVHWQGEIRAVVTTATEVGNCAFVDFFSWVDGSHTFSQLIPLTKFTKPQDGLRFYKLFPSKEARDEYYARKHALRNPNHPNYDIDD
jgi:hypothetical protein